MGKIYVVIVTAILAALLLHGCGSEIKSNIDSVEGYEKNETVVPYTLPQFQPVLDRCKLQYSEGAAYYYKKLKTFKAPYFYARDGVLYFTINKTKEMHTMRCELRGKEEWRVSDTNAHLWHAKVRCFVPKKGVDAYNFMQLHGTTETFNYPLIRLLWVRERQGISDHLWAIVIVSEAYNENKKYEWVDLGKRTDDYITADVNVTANIMTLKINGKVIKQYDVSNWQNVLNYYKAGAYIHRPDDHGTAMVAFKELMF